MVFNTAKLRYDQTDVNILPPMLPVRKKNVIQNDAPDFFKEDGIKYGKIDGTPNSVKHDM